MDKKEEWHSIFICDEIVEFYRQEIAKEKEGKPCQKNGEDAHT